MPVNLYETGEYLAKNPSWHVEDSAWKAHQVKTMLSKHQLKPSSIGEIGCGAGEILVSLSETISGPCTYHGFEVSPDAFELCKGKNTPQLQFTLGNLLDENNTDTFEVLLLMDVFEHVENYMSFLKACRSKASYKIMHIPLDITVLSLLRKNTLLKTRELFGHLHYFTKDTALASLKDAEYTIVDYWYTGSSTDRPVHSLKAKLAKLPRKLLFSLNQDLAAKVLGGFSLLVLAR